MREKERERERERARARTGARGREDLIKFEARDINAIDLIQHIINKDVAAKLSRTSWHLRIDSCCM